MSGNAATNWRARKPLNHSAHFHGRFGATYFITVCCQRRGVNQHLRGWGYAKRINNTSESTANVFVPIVEILLLKESAEKRRRFIRDADDLVRCLTVEFKIELALGSTVVPVGKMFK